MVAQQNQEMALRRKEKFWSQKARCCWLKDGDKNTLFFHSVVKYRHNRSFIHAIKDGQGKWLHSQEEINKEGSDFFQKLFNSEGCVVNESLLSCIPSLVTNGDNLNLTDPRP